MAGKEEGFFENVGETGGNLMEIAGDTAGAIPVPLVGAIPTAAGNIAQGAFQAVGDGLQVGSDILHGEFGEALDDAWSGTKNLATNTVGGIASTLVAATGAGAVNVAADAGGYASRAFGDSDEETEKKEEVKKAEEQKKVEEEEKKKEAEEKEGPGFGQMLLSAAMAVIAYVVNSFTADEEKEQAPAEKNAEAPARGGAQSEPRAQAEPSPELIAEAQASVNADIRSQGEAESVGVQAHVVAPEREANLGRMA